MQPAADKTYMLFGLAKFTLLLMLTLLAAFSHKVNPTVSDLSPSSPLHFMQATPSGSARSDALAASSPLHFMQATPSASARSDALAASSPLHFMQATPSGSARSDALAASSPLHFRQGHYLLTIGPTNSISVNLDDPGSAKGGEDDPLPAAAELQAAPRQLLLTSAPLAPAAELQAAPRQHHLLDASPLPAAAELQAAPRQLLLTSGSLAAAELQASLPIVDNSTGFPPLQGFFLKFYQFI
ncbi:hypothetical protein T492DRAFT_904740 [Pavlovales sp. CCMP2436]|nr:hypothetical protein T492DRAFT_904740 [Pavlovales sp. CCMP2436]